MLKVQCVRVMGGCGCGEEKGQCVGRTVQFRICLIFVDADPLVELPPRVLEVDRDFSDLDAMVFPYNCS